MENEVHISEYLQIIKRRFLYFLIPFVLVGVLGAGFVVILPPIYQSKGVILVESQQIPTELIRSTITSYAAERIQLIKQRVMTRENLLRLAEKFEIFRDAKEKMTATEIVDGMRKNITISVSKTNQSKKGASNIVFGVAFEHKRPQIALQVTNELITLFLSENVSTRTERASETTSFLTDQAQVLKKELEQIENQIAQFKQENSEALPEHLDLHLNMLERSQTDLKKIGLEMKDMEEEKRFLEIELSSLRSLSASGLSPQVAQKSEKEQLETLLKEKLLTYGQAHPEVKSIKNRLAALGGTTDDVSDANATTSTSTVNNIAIEKIKLNIETIEGKKKILADQEEKIKARIEQLEGQIVKTPQVERGLISLSRDYENSLKKYEELREKEMEAKFSENLEAEQKAERFSLLEPPVIADQPIRPDRKKMGMMAAAAAFAAGAGCLLLVEMLDQSVRGLTRLERILQHETMVAIPYIQTEKEIRNKKRRLIALFILFVIACIGAAVAVHMFYKPLDLLMYKILNRLQ